MKWFAFAVVLALGACTGNRGTAVSSYDRANVQEDLQIRLSANASQALIAELQRKAYFNNQVQVRVDPLFLPQETARIAASSYVLAFNDARTKAEALAARVGASLSAPREITEALPSAPQYGGSISGGTRLAVSAVHVNATPNQPITLSVTFGLANDPSRTISVFGMSASDRSVSSLRNAEGLNVDLSARGPDLPTASSRLRAADAALRTLARNYGARAQAFSVVGSTFNTY
ncbi:MAG: SIMPL domain-containing protein [Candidatus Baltobacteraceae bacterium]